MKTFRNPPDIHPPLGSYSHQVEIRGPERLLSIAGQVGRRIDGSVPTDPYAQLDLALDNLFRNLQAAGMEPADLVKLTFYLVGEMEPARRRAVVAARLGDLRPTMTTVYVAGLATPEYRVEVDAWASRAD